MTDKYKMFLLKKDRGYTSKTLMLRKLDLPPDLETQKQLDNLFDNPDSYLTLPEELKVKCVVGKAPTGPRTDAEGQLIPYTYVGSPKRLKGKKNTEGPNSMGSSRVNWSMSRQSKTNLTPSNKYVQFLEDDKIKSEFAKFKDYSRLNDRNEFLKRVPSDIKENLIRQEKNLKRSNINLYQSKKLKESIIHRLNASEEAKEAALSEFGLSTERVKPKKDKDELLMESTDMYRLTNGAFKYLNYKKDTHFLTNKNYWIMSLRRPEHFKGVRESYAPSGSMKNPRWVMNKEHCPNYYETVVNPRWNKKEKWMKKVLFSGELENSSSKFQSFTMGEQNNFNSNRTLNDFKNKSSNLMSLEISGKNLLNLEEEAFKNMKGKKKRLIVKKVDPEALREITIAQTYPIIAQPPAIKNKILDL